MVELVVPAGIQLHDRFGRPEIQVMGLADTGPQIDLLAGEELFVAGALNDAPNPVQLVTVRRQPLSGGRNGVFATVRLPVESPDDGIHIFKCVQVFIHVAAIGPRVIFGFPFLLRYGLAVVPGRETLVSTQSFYSRRKTAYQHGTMSREAHEVASAPIPAEYDREVVCSHGVGGKNTRCGTIRILRFPLPGCACGAIRPPQGKAKRIGPLLGCNRVGRG